MTLLRTGLRLGRRRSVAGVAIFAGILCGLGSSIMQELAHSQRSGYERKVVEARRSASDCQPGASERRCREEQAALEANVDFYGRQTDALGARARPLQTVGGSMHWAQAWLVTLLGIAAVLVAVALTVSADVEAGRLLPGWHPFRRSRRPLAVAAVAGATAAWIVAGGALFGSLVAATVGGQIWPLGDEPRQFEVEGLGPVAASAPSAGWVVAWASVLGVVILIGWFARRTLVAILAGALLFLVITMLASALPAWAPGVSLPAGADMWFHHRGEVAHLWTWPVTPLENGTPSTEWTALTKGDPGLAPLAGAVIALLVALAGIPSAVRRRLA